MLSQQKLRIRTLVMVFALMVGSNIGDLMLKRGMTEIGAVELSAHDWRAGVNKATG